MFTRQRETDAPTHPTVLFIAATLVGFFATTLLGADVHGPRNEPPGLLPPMERARPMPTASADQTTAEALFQVLEEHASGRVQDAASTWRRIDLPQQSEVWRNLGLGVAYLHQDNLDAARKKLAVAQKLDPTNAAVHYFIGLLRLERADQCLEYADAVRDTRTRLISYDKSDRASAASKPKSRYELEAMESLGLAIRYAPDLDYHAPLVPVSWVVHALHPEIGPDAPPTVAELLDALGADNFVGKAHGLLAQLCLDHGRPDEAELHTDEADSHEISVPYGYRQVGELYEEQGRSTDAFRAYMKAMKQGDGLAKPGAKAFENLRKAFEELL